MLKEKQITRFDNLDGLRAIGCLGIIAMHIKANADYQTSSYIYNNMVSTWTVFVYLFLIISGFGMFCGYYEKIKNREIDINQFYLKRYKKLLPFFAFLLVIDVVMERSLDHLIEAFTELTMIFGLLPNNNPNAIGVSWTLGVIFLFYMLMPFFVFLCYNRIRALLSLWRCRWFWFISATSTTLRTSLLSIRSSPDTAFSIALRISLPAPVFICTVMR